MDALFMEEQRLARPCDAEAAPRSFYCPTQQRPVSKQHKTALLTPTKLSFDRESSGQQLEVSVARKGDDADSPSSLAFNESWPSSSPSSQLQSSSPLPPPSPVVEPTLASYVHRFRQAPPTSRATRPTPLSGNQFWWKRDDVTQSAPPKHSSPSNKASSSTESFQVSSLSSTSQLLTDKSSSVRSSSVETPSPPAQKYLNTRHSVSSKEPPLGAAGRGGGGGGEGSTGEGRACCALEDDILVQWRVRRRLEQARREAGQWAGSQREAVTTAHDMRRHAAIIPSHQHWSCDILRCEHCHDDGPSDNQSSTKQTGAVLESHHDTSSPLPHTPSQPASPVDTLASTEQPLTASEPPSHAAVIYPSPSALRPRLLTKEAPDGGAESDCLSLTFTSLADHTLLQSTPPDSHSTVLQSPEVPNPHPPELHSKDPSCPEVHSPEVPSKDLHSAGVAVSQVVSQAVGTHLFAPPSSPPSHPHTPSPPSHPHTPSHLQPTSPDENSARSNDRAATSELVDSTCDSDLGDEILKLLITKAKGFEARIRDIDSVLSAMGSECAHTKPS